MRHFACLAILLAVVLVVTVALAPTPDAISFMVWLIGYFAVAALGYWLGLRSGQASQAGKS